MGALNAVADLAADAMVGRATVEKAAEREDEAIVCLASGAIMFRSMIKYETVDEMLKC